SVGNAATIGSAVINGSLLMNLGDGNNLVEFGSQGSVGGNVNVTAGNGNNDFSNTVLGGFAGNIGGSLSFNLGNGNDSASVSSPVGGLFSWRSGNGADSVQLGSGSNSYN